MSNGKNSDKKKRNLTIKIDKNKWHDKREGGSEGWR